MSELIITNGDGAADLLVAAGRSGRIMPWRDVLHEGPILAEFGACTRARVAYLAARFGLEPADIAAEFAARDAIVAAHAGFDRIELWFEHDLYDQLQLLQILAFLAEAGRSDGVVLVQADDFLGRQRADTILRFAGKARPVETEDLNLAQGTWRNLAAATPEAVAQRLTLAGGRLPHLQSALRRFLEELPAPGNGLGRTEATAVQKLADGPTTPSELFRAVLATEEAAFMGDLPLFRLLEDLAFCPVPLIDGLAPPARADDGSRFSTARLALTVAGEDVLAGKDDQIPLNGIDRWWGGTHLAGESVWRYDRHRGRLIAPSRDSRLT
jgi:hypothetical protein